MKAEEPFSPVVSVIIPAFQAEKTLARALDSVLAICNISLEVVVVDDGSTDDTFAIAQRFAAADLRVNLIRQENGGRSAARNRGFSAARGEWIMFLDSDDYLLPDAGAILAAALAAANADLVIFGFIVKGDEKLEIWAGYMDRPNLDCGKSVGSLETASSRVLLAAMINGGWDLTTPTQRHFEQNACWARVYRRSRLISLVGRLPDGWAPFAPGLRFSEDRILNLSYLSCFGNDAVEFFGYPIYCWDLVESNTVRRVKVDDVKAIGVYHDCLLQLFNRGLITEKDSGLLYAREVIAQFRRMVLGLGSAFPTSDLLAAWQEVVSDRTSARVIMRAPRECLGDGAVWMPAAIMLSRGLVTVAFAFYGLLFKVKTLFR